MNYPEQFIHQYFQNSMLKLMKKPNDAVTFLAFLLSIQPPYFTEQKIMVNSRWSTI